MLKDIKQLTELYLQKEGVIPAEKTWDAFHEEIIINASLDGVKVLTDAIPNKCKYALFVDVDTKVKTCEIKDYVEIGAIEDWTAHLFWQGSGGAKSDKIRNTPHKIYSKKGDFSTDKFVSPLKTILEDYCRVQNPNGKKKTIKETGPLFWDINKEEETRWLKNVIDILEEGKESINKQVKGDKKQRGKFPSLKPGESVFVGLTIDHKPIGEYELFRRYLLFVRTRAGVQKGTDKFKHKIASGVIEELTGICPSCHREKPLLDQWPVTAELSFYQITNESHSSYAYPSATFRLCQSCADLLFIFKQCLLETLTRKLGGNECLILPSIKLIPSSKTEKGRLFENLNRLWNSSSKNVAPTEKRLLHRLGKLPSYATVTFIFGDYIRIGKSQNVRRLDELNIIFPDVLPSRLSQIANEMKETNQHLYDMWSLTGRNWQCQWQVQDDFYLLQELFHPSWDEDKQNRDKKRKHYKSLRRPEMERYLRTIFYGENITYDEIASDCFSNLISAIKITRKAKGEDKDKYAKEKYIGNLLSLFVFIEKLKVSNEFSEEEYNMIEEMIFEFKAMPELGKFIEMHPLLKDKQYRTPFCVGCLFSYAENLQKENSRLAAYNWLGTMTLGYNDILQDIYPKVLNYITNKEKIVSSQRLQELMKAVAHFDKGRCDNDRMALVAFCHGWAIGRDFIYMPKKDIKTN